MKSGLFNLAVGVIMVVTGVTGELRLLGTGSSTALSILGALIAGAGVFQIIRAKRSR